MQNRTVIDHVQPQINQGRFPIKRVVGEWVNISASIIGDGHDKIRAKIQYRQVGKKKWQEVELDSHPNDIWTGRFQITEQKHYQYRLLAWVDQLLSWYEGFKKKQADGQEMSVEIQIGINLLTATAKTYSKTKAAPLQSAVKKLKADEGRATEFILSEEFAKLVRKHPFVQHETVYDHDLRVRVGRLKERYSSWYELF
ncbi:MAG: maltotransferase domain-containing protein, partial [Bacteroidota bacterium]